MKANFRGWWSGAVCAAAVVCAAEPAKNSFAVLPAATRNVDPDFARAFARRLSDALAKAAQDPVLTADKVQARLAERGTPWGRRAALSVDACAAEGRRLGVKTVVWEALWARDRHVVLTLRAVKSESGLIDAEISDIVKEPDELLAKVDLIAEAILSREQPAPVDKTKKPEPSPQELLEEGKRLQAKREWRKAMICYQKVRQTSLADEELDRRIEACYKRLALEARYLNPDFVRTAKNLSQETGERLLGGILTRIERYYVTPQNSAHLAAGVVKQLKMLTESEAARKKFAALDRPADRAKLLAAAKRFEGAGFSRTDLNPTKLLRALDERVVKGHGTDLPPGVILLEAIQGVLGALDKYSLYLPIERLRDLEIQTSGHFFGIGAEVGLRGRLMAIITPLFKSPALRAGLRAGDRVLLIDGHWGPPDITLDQAVAKLRGPYGAPVEVVVVTEGEAFPVKRRIVRGAIEVASVREAKMLEDAPGVGYVRVVSFRRHTARDLSRALRRLEAEGLRALVLDLRGNGGGLLDAAVGVCDLFISRGVIVSTRGRIPSSTRTYKATRAGTHPQWPVAVLVNGRSASASEIVASMIRDHRRGPLVGTRTVGKGSVQAMFRLKDKWGFKTLAGVNLTIARYYPPCGKSFDGKGITPDIVVDLPAKALGKILARRYHRWILHNDPDFKSRLTYWRDQEAEEAKETDIQVDPQLAAAVRALKKRMTRRACSGEQAPKQLAP